MFDALPQQLRPVAAATLIELKNRYGKSGLKFEESLSPDVSWRPTIQVKNGKFQLVAVEVSEVVLPKALRYAISELADFDTPVSTYVATSETAFLDPKAQVDVKRLTDMGVGLYTVNSDGTTTTRFSAVPVQQMIVQAKFEEAIDSLTPTIKVRLRGAYEIYRTDAIPGIQKASQVIEAMARRLASHCAAKAWLKANPGAQTLDLATIIDELYQLRQMANHRGALGGARNFVKKHRNPASHPPKNGAEALRLLVAAREGFSAALHVAVELREVFRQLNLRIEFVD